MPEPARHPPLKIALTGGIGSGKSTVARILRELGFVVIEADEIAHEVLQNESVKKGIREAFGPEVFFSDGSVDRKKLARIVFRDREKLRLLESIVHPAIRQRLEALENAALARVNTVVSVIPLLFEKSLEGRYQQVWVTDAPLEVCRQRLRDRDGLSDREIAERFAALMSPDEKRKRAHIVFETNRPLEELRTEIARRVRHLL